MSKLHIVKDVNKSQCRRFDDNITAALQITHFCYLRELTNNDTDVDTVDTDNKSRINADFSDLLFIKDKKSS